MVDSRNILLTHLMSPNPSLQFISSQFCVAPNLYLGISLMKLGRKEFCLAKLNDNLNLIALFRQFGKLLKWVNAPQITDRKMPS